MAVPISISWQKSWPRWPAACTHVVVRAGAYIIHDDGFYTGITPFGRGGENYRLRSAMHTWARVVSRPEPRLALLDAGKRDVPFDEGLPTPQLVASQLGAPARPLTNAEIVAVNDQHAFLTIPTDSDIRVGDVVRLGLSTPVPLSTSGDGSPSWRRTRRIPSSST